MVYLLNLELVENPGDHGEHMPTHPLVVLTYITRHGLTLADEQVPHDQSNPSNQFRSWLLRAIR